MNCVPYPTQFALHEYDQWNSTAFELVDIHNEADTEHLLGQANDESTNLGRRYFGLRALDENRQ